MCPYARRQALMRTVQERILLLEKALFRRDDICSSEGGISSFPVLFHSPYLVSGVGIVVCVQGSFTFALNHRAMQASAGETLFIPEGVELQVIEESPNLEVHFLLYQVEPIRDILGNQVVSMYLYSQLVPEPCYVWQTGEEVEVLRYMTQLDATLHQDDPFRQYEQKLLLLALTHRLCSLYNRKLVTNQDAVGHRNEVFLKLIQLIEQYYVQERGVEFYADKLCLSPKYLSAMCKSICGYTVQELVFKSIIRKSISLLKNTQKNVQEIADYFNFPNASYFGTFFKKQMGVSPQQYRKSITS